MSLRPLEGLLAVRSEGGLLPADLLQRIVAGNKDVEGLDPERDYHLAGGERLNEAVSRSWQRLLGAWRNFRAAAAFVEPGDAGTSVTREKWLLVLFQELGYGRLTTSKAVSIEAREYPISHAWQGVPIHLVGCRVEIDKRTPGVAGAARVTPHGLVQDFLNRSPDHLWGFVTNGLRLRILRDNARLTRQAYVEFDVETIFENELYADFGLLWLLCHESRVEQDRPEAYWLERWRESAAKQGARALDTLRDGVEAALLALGRGFLAHPSNASLKAALRAGSLSTQDYYRELLRLVYRLLFLFVAEDRDVLHPRGHLVTAQQRYLSHYSSRRLRELARRMRGSGHSDLFRMFKVVVGGLSAAEGCAALGLPALGGLLWSDQAAPQLDSAELANRDWLETVRALAYTRQEGVLRPVDWRNLGSTELGSVYESLLELHPDVNADAATFSLTSAAGNERKTSGSYYTPESLVQCLLDSALDPVLTDAASKPDPERAILALKVCDPACGSGHFLIAAAHRIARRLAIVRTGDDEPAPEATRTSLRDVIGRCLYGVDLNEMAAELCKVNLWLEGLEPGRPLSFLDHHIRVGNSLLGATPDLIARDIPDDAFEPIEGDDRKACLGLKKRNRIEREGQQDMLHLMVSEPPAQYLSLGVKAAALDEIPDSSLEDVHAKEARFRQLVQSQEYEHAYLVADAWFAVFVWRKVPGPQVTCPTTEAFRRLKADKMALSQAEIGEVRSLASQYNVFHWHLAFPEVFAKGGFDVVIGNPPWERVKLQEKEWFANRRGDVASASNAAQRRRMIAKLELDDPTLWNEWIASLRHADGESHVFRSSGRFPMCGVGRDINAAAVFAELMLSSIAPRGCVGCIVPSAVGTDDTTKAFFRAIMSRRALVSFYDFDNRDALFPAVHSGYKICLMTLVGTERTTGGSAEFAFFLHNIGDLQKPESRFTLSDADITLLSPNTGTCPVFRSKRDAHLALALYNRTPVLAKDGREDPNQWSIETRPGHFHMSNDAELFLVAREPTSATGPDVLPLYEAKMMHQFDHRWFSYASGDATDQQRRDAGWYVFPRYFVPRDRVAARLRNLNTRWHLVVRDITNSTNERTMIATIVPEVGVAGTLMLLEGLTAGTALDLLGCLNSLAADYLARQRVAGTHLNPSVFKQIPVLQPSVFRQDCRWQPDTSHGFWLSRRTAELCYTAWDLQPFARDAGWPGPPYRWDEERRFVLRCELDAAFFHLYLGHEEEWRRQPESLTKDFPTPRHAVDYIMETFPIVKRRDEESHGEYRTKRLILEIYDEMQQAMNTGRAYQTPLDPPPADPKVAHPSDSARPAFQYGVQAQKLRKVAEGDGE